MLADRIAWLGLVSNDVAGAARVFEEFFQLPRKDLESPVGKVPAFALGKASLALFEPEHPLCDGETKTGVHHIALAAPDMAASVAKAGAAGLTVAGETAGLGGGWVRRLGREAKTGVRLMLATPPALPAHAPGALERIDHIGIASTDVREDEAVFSGKLGFEVESRQTDMEVTTTVESFTSDKYGVIYHSRAPVLGGGLRVTFITVGDCELEFLANFDPRQKGEVEKGTAGTTKQDQGAIARFVASRGRGLHHMALKTPDIDALLGRMAKAGVPMIDTVGRPGSRRAKIGFPHPKALCGVLMHLVQRDPV